MSRLVQCDICDRWCPAGAPACGTCRQWLQADLEAAWRIALAEYDVPADGDEERAFAQTIVDDPRSVRWRVVDSALLRLSCPACGNPLGSGPADCSSCHIAHGNRWLAAEPDRPGVRPGNEHAIRVSTAIALVPQRFPEHVVRLYVSLLPLTIAGQLPTTPQAQAIKAYVDAHGGDLGLIYRARSVDEIDALIHTIP